MPNRIIREGFLDSSAVHALSDAAECFYHRLLLAADDAGRFDGRVDILRARLFPLDSSRRVSDVEKSLALCVKEGLVIPYDWEGQPYLQLTKVYRASPAVTSKYPWSDGTFRFGYIRRQTRDGEKEFVKTSIPYGRDAEGIGKASDPLGPQPTGDGDEDEDGDEDDRSPASSVLDAYHRILPKCQSVAVLNDKRRKRIAAAVKLARSVCKQQGWPYIAADFWTAYFTECAKDAWMRGEVPNPKNSSWRQNLDVLLAEDRFAGVMDQAIEAMRGQS